MNHEIRRWAAFGLAVSLSGCASFAPQRGVSETAGLIAERGGRTPSAVTSIDCTSAQAALGEANVQGLSAETAVQIALTCNPTLAAEYARLGIANAEAFEAGRLANPSLRLGVADVNGADGGTKIELGIAQNFTNLILRGPRTRLADGEFLRAQQLLAGSVLNLAVDVKTSYYRLIGARQIAAARAAIAEAASISAELGRRFRAAGNLGARELAVIEAASIEAKLQHRQAEVGVAETRATLQRQLGVDLLPDGLIGDALPALLAAEESPDTLRSQALAQRLDLAATRKLVELIADSAATTKRLRWLGEFELGVDYEREPDHSRLIGPSLSIQLPLFHQGQGAVARAESSRRWSEAEVRRLTLDVTTAVDLASRQVRGARARVEDIQGELLPRRADVVARTQEEYNFMLRGAFELLDARIAEYAAAQDYFEALRDYWIARGDLERAVGARLTPEPSTVIRAGDVLGTRAAVDHSQMDHSKMDHSKMDHSTHGGDPDAAAADTQKVDHSRMHHPMPAAPSKVDAKPAASKPADADPAHDHHGHDTSEPGDAA